MGEIHLLKGGDEVLLAEEAHRLVQRLVGDDDRDQVLEEFTGDDYDLGAVVLAATTVSMFGDRVVVARNLARFGRKPPKGQPADVQPLLDLLADPPPDASLVLVWSRPSGSVPSQSVPPALTKAVNAAGGEVHDCGVPVQRAGRDAWWSEQFGGAGVTLSAAAKQVVQDHLGEDAARLAGILSVLEEVHGTGAGPLTPEDVEPFLGRGGGVPPWELTDAIDQGDVAGAVDRARRMVAAGDRHPLVVMATLQTHVLRMVRLDGAGVTSEQEAAALLGLKGSTFPAKKALAQARRLGTDQLARAVQLLAAADVDLRGRTALPADQVLEVLVARLARLSAGGPGSGRGGAGRGRAGGRRGR